MASPLQGSPRRAIDPAALPQGEPEKR